MSEPRMERSRRLRKELEDSWSREKSNTSMSNVLGSGEYVLNTTILKYWDKGWQQFKPPA